MMEKAEGGGRKIEVRILYNKYYWAIQYEKDLEIDGNILFFIESAKELLPGYIKTSRGLILPRELYYALTNIKGLVPCGSIPGLFRLSSLPFGDSCDVFRLSSQIPYILSPQGLLSCLHSSPMMSYWERVDERPIKRGMLIMDLDFVRGYRDELVRMNWRKRGRPYRIAESYVRFLAVIRYLFSLGYRQLEGLTRSLGRIFP
jgi:hypothetical protein